jgi:hypothetical protein
MQSALDAQRISEEKGYAIGMTRARAETVQIGAPIRATRRDA